MVKKIARQIARQIARKIVRGIVTLANDSEGIQVLQVETLRGDVHEVPRMQQYGLTSVPHDGAEVVLAMINDSEGLVISVDDRRYRLKGLQKGEVALYDDQGTKIHIKRGGNIHVVASTKITVDTPLAEFSGDVNAKGNIKDNIDEGGFTMKQMRELHNDHDHGENGGSGPTDKPNQKF